MYSIFKICFYFLILNLISQRNSRQTEIKSSCHKCHGNSYRFKYSFHIGSLPRMKYNVTYSIPELYQFIISLWSLRKRYLGFSFSKYRQSIIFQGFINETHIILFIFNEKCNYHIAFICFTQNNSSTS